MEDPLSAPYVIRPFTEADVALAHRWRRRPHVQKWWGDPAGEPEEEKLSDGRIAMWIAEDRSGPLGFIQDYRVHGWEDHPFAYLPEGSRGIDLYLAMMRRGAAVTGLGCCVSTPRRCWRRACPPWGSTHTRRTSARCGRLRRPVSVRRRARQTRGGGGRC